MKNIFGHILRELRELLPAFIFFFVTFHLLSATRAFILKEYGIMVTASAIATIGAIIMAKVVFLTDKLPFLNLYPRKPLFYNVILKTMAFSTAALLFFVIEEMLRLSIKTGSPSAAWGKIAGDINWPAFWLRQAWLTLLISVYCAAIELIRVLGVDKVKSIFFGTAKK